jgi:arabinose-5-phosphate isomerase
MSNLDEARRVLRIEAEALIEMVERVDERFDRAVELILKSQGKLIVTGVGKSGHIARKIASTFSSTGTPALFLHPTEGSHGDLGVISKDDLVLAMSYRGTTPELTQLISFLARRNIPLIAMTGNMTSPLATAATIVLDVSVREEACPLGLAPTTSTTATMALGDALAMTVLSRRGFKKEQFAEYHPGGSLGRRLLTKVRDVMHVGDALPLVGPNEDMTKVISAMTGKEVRGVAGVVDEQGQLIGVITDGDIRRRFERSNAPLTEKAKDLMSRNPKMIDAEELAEKALFVMEQFKIQTLFAVDLSSGAVKRPTGLLHLQDLLKAQIR